MRQAASHIWEVASALPFDHAVLYSGAIGCAIYLLSRFFRWSKPEGVLTFEAVAFGCGIAMGAHLAYCTFHPEHLVHLREGTKGRELTLAELQATDVDEPKTVGLVAEMDVAHSIHVFGAGVLTSVLASLGLGKICISRGSPDSSH